MFMHKTGVNTKTNISIIVLLTYNIVLHNLIKIEKRNGRWIKCFLIHLLTCQQYYGLFNLLQNVVTFINTHARRIKSNMFFSLWHLCCDCTWEKCRGHVHLFDLWIIIIIIKGQVKNEIIHSNILMTKTQNHVVIWLRLI